MTTRSRAGPARGVPGPRILRAAAAVLGAILLLPRGAGGAGGDAAAKDAEPATIAEPPPAYRGAALPLVARDTASLLARAEEHIAAEDWARAFAVLDEVLERVTAPRGRKMARARPERSAGAVEQLQGGLDAPAGPAAVAPVDPEVDPADEVHSPDGILFVPVASHVRRRLAGLPPEARAVYRSTYEAPAREALRTATGLPAARAIGELGRIAERYPLTLAGAEAWDALSERLLGAGRPAEAALALEARLETPPEDPAERATALARLAVAALAAHEPGPARRALDRIASDHPETLVKLRGEPVRGRDLAAHPFFRSLLEAAARRRADGRDAGPAWVSEGGSFDHAAYPASAEDVPPLGSRARWIFPAPGPEEPGAPAYQGPSARGVSHGGTAYARIGAEIIALDVRSGKRIWSAEPGTLRPGPERGVATRTRLHVHQGQAMSSDLSLAVIPAAGPGKRALLAGIDRPPQMNQTADGRLVFDANLLVAYDAASGKLLWSLEDAPRDGGLEEDPEGALAFTAPPVAAGGLLVAPALKGDSLHAVGISPGGKVRWSRRLYAYNQAYYTQYGFQVSAGSSLAAGLGLVAAANGHGIACVLDAASGDLLWASRYRSDARVSGHAGRFVFFDASRSRPPVIADDTLLVFPPDGDHVTAFDLRSGEVRWERRMGPARGEFLLGADSERAYVAGDALRALRIADGGDAWESAAIGPPAITSGAVAGGRIIVAAGGVSRLAAIEPETGKVASDLRVIDPRIASPDASLFLAPGEILATSAGRVLAFEPQDVLWKAIGEDDEKRLHERARLLRTEGRHEEAIAVLDRLRARVRSKELRASIEKDILAAARAAADSSGKASFIGDLLARPDPIVEERRDVIGLRLLEASLLEKEGDRAGAARIHQGLLGHEGVLAISPEGFEVDAGTYASGALRMLRAAGVEAADPAGEARAREILDGEPGAAALSRILFRRSHLDAAAGAARRLAARAEEDGDPRRAAEILALAGLGYPGDPAPGVASTDSAPATDPAPAIPTNPAPAIPTDPAPGLAEVLEAAGGKPLRKAFWLAPEDGFLAATAPGSLPLPALVAIEKTAVRLHGPDGKLLLERPLPDYPDISDLKISLQSHLEEPAIARAHADHVLLFTAAGLYDLGGLGGASAGVRPGDFRIRWTSPWRHTFAEMPRNTRRFWGGPLSLAQGENSFPELGEAPDSRPVVLFRDGTLVAYDARSGKRVWRSMSDAHGAASPPVLEGTSIAVATARPPGITVHRAVERAGEGGNRRTGRFVPGPPKNVTRAILAAGGLAAAFSGETLEVIEVETERLLWRSASGSSTVVHAEGPDLWLSEPGKLVCRSIRSGRERWSLPLPQNASVVDVVERLPTDAARTLIVSRGASARSGYSGYYSRTETGTDLHAIAIDAEGKKIREVEIHKGPVTYDGGRMRGPRRSLLLFFNGATEPEKWYTRAVLIGPGGEVQEVLSAELEGKGTGQPPRIAILRGGLGVGNAGGFGWYAPAGAGPDGGVGPGPAPAEEAARKEPEGR